MERGQYGRGYSDGYPWPSLPFSSILRLAQLDDLYVCPYLEPSVIFFVPLAILSLLSISFYPNIRTSAVTMDSTMEEEKEEKKKKKMENM